MKHEWTVHPSTTCHCHCQDYSYRPSLESENSSLANLTTPLLNPVVEVLKSFFSEFWIENIFLTLVSKKGGRTSIFLIGVRKTEGKAIRPLELKSKPECDHLLHYFYCNVMVQDKVDDTWLHSTFKKMLNLRRLVVAFLIVMEYLQTFLGRGCNAKIRIWKHWKWLVRWENGNHFYVGRITMSNFRLPVRRVPFFRGDQLCNRNFPISL